ncbi:MAG: SusC/RagA family TonB-linked outer membrane protein [Gemmatimonadaceae bacterium]
MHRIPVRRLLLALAGVAASAGWLAAQQGPSRIIGRITDSEGGAPVEGAQVRIDGTTAGAVTLADGRYVIARVQPGQYQLRVIRLGYLSSTQQVTLRPGESVTADFTLSRTAYQIEGVVTTATGQQLTRELGNAIAKVDVAGLTPTQPITSMQDVLNGRTAGVTLISSNGTVGGGSRVRIRGLSSASLSNDPLVIVDGIRMEQGSPNISGSFGDTYVGGGRPNFLNNLNPEEIESMEIIKGPSAATLYGTQSANGVIVITTKKGRQGAAKWNVFAAGGFSQNPFTYSGQYYNKGVDKAGKTVDCISWKEVQGLCTVQQRYQRNLLADKETTPFGTGLRQNYGAQVSGGNEFLRYFISGTWEDETGVLKMPDSELDSLLRERGTSSIPRNQRTPNRQTKSGLRGNFGVPLGTNGDLTISSGFVSSFTLLPQTGDNLNGVIGTGLFGTANPAATSAWGFASPRTGLAKEVTRGARQFINSATAQYRPRSWLTTRATVGLDFLVWQDAARIRSGEGCRFCGIDWQGLRSINKYNNERYSVDFGTTATRRFLTSFDSKTSVGLQWNRDGRAVTFNSAKILPPGGSTIDAGAQKSSSEQTNQFVTFGVYAEQQVGWRDRLYVTGAVRRDQNSAFGENFGAAVYPKGTLSWVVVDDNAAKWVNNFRPRVAWGESGQQPDANASITYLNPVTATLLGQDVPAVSFGAFGNSGLKPERSREIEGGFDFSTLRNRVTLQITYYDKKTTDAIVRRNLAPSQTAGASIFDNVGTVTNKGLEVSLNSRILDYRNLRYDAQVEASWNKNRLESLANGVKPFGGFGYQNAPGQPLFAPYWPAMKSYEDKNKNGVIEPGEVTATSGSVFGGNSVPTRTITLNNSVGLWRDRIRLNGLFDYRGGNVMHQISDGFACALGPNNCRAIHDPTAPLRDQARAIIAGTALGAYWEKGDFVRLREVSATYELPRFMSGAMRARTATLVASGRNLWIWTKEFSGADPESQTQGQDATPYSFVQQAQPRQFLFRVNLSY